MQSFCVCGQFEFNCGKNKNDGFCNALEKKCIINEKKKRKEKT